MELLRPSWGERLAAWLFRPFFKAKGPSDLSPAELTQLYNGQMFEGGNFWHRQIVLRWTSHIKVDETYLEGLKLKAAQGTLVYVTFNLGQLEFCILNNILEEQSLPLSFWNNVLRARRWFPFLKIWQNYWLRIRFLANSKTLPDPLANHYFAKLLAERKSILYSLPERDPQFLPTSVKEFLDHLLAIAANNEKPIFIVPCQLIWDKRPRGERASIFEALFGENEAPGRWRKIILFLRHYRKRAVQKFGEPIALSTFTDSFKLYQKILASFQLERKSLTGPILHSKAWFVEHILASEAMAKTIYEVAKERRKPIETVKNLSRRYIHEIIADLRYHYIELAAAILDWVFKNLFEGINVDKEGIKRLKKTLQQGPTILVPNHRSHLDYLLLGFLCYQNDIVSPYVAAGLNMAFWPMGWISRRCGAFFLRRTFQGNKLYKQVFQTYLQLLIQEGYLQEFFIEGGRSRTGKLRSPKLGMLAMYSEAIHQGAAKDIYFLPVSITYDRVLEEKSYLEEMGGKPKTKERIRDLLKLTRFLKGRYGKIYLHFDEPISWQKTASEIPEADWERKKMRLVPRLADQICHAINQQVVTIPKALAAQALLLTPHRGIPIDQVEKNFFALLHYLQWKKVPRSDTLSKNPRGALQEALQQFVAAGQIKRHEGLEGPFFEIPTEKRAQINFFKNFSIHRFVSLSIWSSLLLARRAEPLELEKLAQEYALFQDLFRYEFRFSTRRSLLAHLDTLCCYLQEQCLLRYSPSAIELLPEGTPLLKNFSALLRNYFEAYAMAWETFLLNPNQPLVEKELVKKTIDYAKDQLLLGRLQYPEAISPVVFTNAIQAFQNLQWFALGPESAGQLKKTLDQMLQI